MSHIDLDEAVNNGQKPVVYVLSDARGETANAVVLAAAAQFGDASVDIVRVPNVTSVEICQNYLDEHFDPERPCAVFHTFADASLRREIRRELDSRGIPSIDLLGPAVTVLSTLTGEEPSRAIGAIFSPDTK